jgi:hypothetical protein
VQVIDPTYTYTNFSLEEQAQILKVLPHPPLLPLLVAAFSYRFLSLLLALSLTPTDPCCSFFSVSPLSPASPSPSLWC